MPALARVDDCADAVVTAIKAAWTTRQAPDDVTAVYAPDIGLNPDQPDTLVSGRQVFVFAEAWAAAETVSRADVRRRYTVWVLTVERYTESAAPVPVEWIRERTAFVESLANLFAPGSSIDGSLSSYYVPPDALPEVQIVADREELIQRAAFWSVLVLSLDQLVNFAGQ